MRRAVLALYLLAIAARPAAADSSALAMEIVNLRSEWRFEEAIVKLDQLKKEAPTAPATVYLTAEFAYLTGDYARALELLEKIPEEQGPRVAEIRDLVSGTYAATKDFVSYQSSGGHFIILYPPGKDELIAPIAGEVLETAYQKIGQDLGYFPPAPVRVEILSQPSDLARVSTLTVEEIETTGTIALCKYNKLMAVTPRATVFGYPWMDTLVHEYVHYVVSRVTYDQTPVWLHEGLARFEQVRWRKDLDELPKHENRLLARALKKNTLISFDAMHPSMAKLPSQEAAALAFAEVFTMIGFIHGTTGHEGLRSILDFVKQGRDARDAVAQTMLLPFADVETRWRQHLATLSLDPRGDDPGAGKIRFRKGKSDDENVGLDEISNKDARKFARLGGLLRARGHSAAAAVEYEKAMKLTGPNQRFIVGKLARTYLELEQPERAANLVRPLAAADERDATAATTLGRALLLLADHPGARTALEQALRISPFDPMVRCGLADAYATLNDPRAARERAACQKLAP